MKNTEEPVSVSWGKIKIAALNKYFDRIETTHEEIAVLKPPRSYMKKKQLIEREYEATLIILQDNMEIKSVEGIKLPRLEITEFTGSYFEWVNFRDLFQASVVDNKNLANTQKMQLLRTHLDKEAKDLIKDSTLTNSNFKVAWSRLQNRYENKKVIVHQYLQKLITQPHLKNDSNDSTQLKKLLDTTDQILATLRNLDRL